jgi:hypothetical protein
LANQAGHGTKDSEWADYAVFWANGDEMGTVQDALPPGYKVDTSAPALDTTLVGRELLFLWSGVGWEHGAVCKFYRKLYTSVFNFEIEYGSGDRHDTLLRPETYGCSGAVKPGSWVTVSKKR